MTFGFEVMNGAAGLSLHFVAINIHVLNYKLKNL